MRITTWNINGLRTLRQYRPWYALKDWQACLDYLEADIICFQEVKLTRKALVSEHRDMCVPAGYEAYFSLHPGKGYSGVATFVKKDVCHVRKAEQGLTGELVANRQDARTSIGGYPDVRAPELPVYDQIDQEGRAVVVDCGLFVLFNLYCPNETDEGRREYKMAYYLTLAERVENLLSQGREVIIVGDMNIAHLPIDHCEGVDKRTRDEHLDIHPARHWLDRFLAPNGVFHDITRRAHPKRKFMYTCWDTVKDTRPSNYGVRIDYTLVSRNLLPWIKAADIQPDVFGSDHCPVYVDLHDEIQNAEGKTIRLRDVLMLPTDAARTRKAPSLATTNWSEFSGRKIQSFFTPSRSSTANASIAAATVVPDPVITAPSPTPPPAATTKETAAAAAVDSTTSPTKRMEKKALVSSGKRAAASSHGRTGSVSAIHSVPGQRSLRAFFGQSKPEKAPLVAAEPDSPSKVLSPPPPSDSQQSDYPPSCADDVTATATVDDDNGIDAFDDNNDDDDDGTSSANRVASALAWGSIFAPKEPPLCWQHREPARPWTVNKPGPNHGRKFWMCARPVGGSGAGSGPDDKQFRCSFWKWDSDVRRSRQQQQQQQQSTSQEGGDAAVERSFHEVAGKAPRLGSGEKRGWNAGERDAPHKSTVKRTKH